MDLTTTKGMSQYLSSAVFETTDLEKLSGGTANYIWRTYTSSDTKEMTQIVKHAEPHLASNPRFPIALDRMDFENTALTALPKVLPKNIIVKPPAVHHYDAVNHVIVMEDGGPRNLKDAYSDPTLNIQHLGSELGKWLATLHLKTINVNIGDNATAKQIYRYSYSNLASTARHYDLDPSLGERIDANYGSLLQSDNECLCHGDFWPGNIIVGAQSQPQLTVVDWEITRRGCSATDVAQFAAEAYLLDRFRGQRGLVPVFLAGYREVRGKVSKSWFQRVAVHMGAHLSFWPSRVKWGDEGETREVVVLGNEIMRRAESEDWGWFEEGEGRGLLGGLCVNGLSE